MLYSLRLLRSSHLPFGGFNTRLSPIPAVRTDAPSTPSHDVVTFTGEVSVPAAGVERAISCSRRRATSKATSGTEKAASGGSFRAGGGDRYPRIVYAGHAGA